MAAPIGVVVTRLPDGADGEGRPGADQGRGLLVEHVSSDQVHPEEDPIELGGSAVGMVSAGVAFELGSGVEGPGTGPGDVMAAASGIAPALVVAAADGLRLVVSPRVTRTDGIDLGLIGVLVERDGVQVATAAGASAPFGHPAAAVAAAARIISANGGRLDTGWVVFSGALAPAVPAGAGSHVRATFAHIGSVGARFA